VCVERERERARARAGTGFRVLGLYVDVPTRRTSARSASFGFRVSGFGFRVCIYRHLCIYIGTYAAYQCKKCKFGPIDHMACADLRPLFSKDFFFFCCFPVTEVT
jgi:hypothetical protein